jgi:hypothetical protein
MGASTKNNPIQDDLYHNKLNSIIDITAKTLDNTFVI